MKEGNYWIDFYGERGPDFVAGVRAGIEAYAHWKDGVRYVGTTGKTLKKALREVDEAFETEKEELE